MKRIISFIVCIILMMSVCITANAAGSSTLNGNSSVTVGSNIEFTVNVSGCGDATSIAAAVTYSDNFELVSGTWLKSGSITKFDTATKKGALGGLSSPNVNGNLFKVVLKAKTASASNQNVSVNVIAKNGSTEIMNVTPSKSVKINCATHNYGNYTNANATNHTRTCSACGAVETKAHTWDGGSVNKTANCKEAGNTHYTCTATGCGATKDVPISKTNNHTYGSWSQTSAPKCTTVGKEQRTCSTCQKVEMRDIKATGKHTYSNNCDNKCNVCSKTRTITHSYETTTKKATTTKNGSVVKACSVCGKVSSTTKIYYAKKVKLSTTEYTYNGKSKKPSVKVYDYKGNKISSSNYEISYKNNKKVGKATVTIKLKGKYSGTLKATFKIVPKESKVEKLTAAKKSLKVKLKKVSSGASGYEIQYSTSKTFKSKYTKTKKVSYKTTSVTLKSLKAKKNYYVRVRTYKTVNGKKYYSDWSSKKTKKTK